MRRRCKCHGEPMDVLRGSSGGWTCAVKRRNRQREYYHRIKNDPTYRYDRQIRDMCRIRVR